MKKYMSLIGQYRKKYTTMNQTEFGDLFEATQQTVSSWESGKSFPPYPILRAIADYFKLETVDELYREIRK